MKGQVEQEAPYPIPISLQDSGWKWKGGKWKWMAPISHHSNGLVQHCRCHWISPAWEVASTLQVAIHSW